MLKRYKTTELEVALFSTDIQGPSIDNIFNVLQSNIEELSDPVKKLDNTVAPSGILIFESKSKVGLSVQASLQKLNIKLEDVNGLGKEEETYFIKLIEKILSLDVFKAFRYHRFGVIKTVFLNYKDKSEVFDSVFEKSVNVSDSTAATVSITYSPRQIKGVKPKVQDLVLLTTANDTYGEEVIVFRVDSNSLPEIPLLLNSVEMGSVIVEVFKFDTLEKRLNLFYVTGSAK